MIYYIYENENLRRYVKCKIFKKKIIKKNNLKTFWSIMFKQKQIRKGGNKNVKKKFSSISSIWVLYG
jgi:hypothetical protein